MGFWGFSIVTFGAQGVFNNHGGTMKTKVLHPTFLEAEELQWDSDTKSEVLVQWQNVLTKRKCPIYKKNGIPVDLMECPIILAIRLGGSN